MESSAERAELNEERPSGLPAASGEAIVLGREELLDIVEGIRLFAEQYGELVDRANDSESWRREALARVLTQQEQVEISGPPLRHMGVMLGLLHHLLQRTGQEQVVFRVPSRVGRVTNGNATELTEFSDALAESTRSVEAVVAELSRFADRLEQGDNEVLRLVLGGVLALVKSLLRQDWDDATLALSYLNLATSSRERHDLVQQIARIAREIYDCLNTFSSEISLEGLSETTEEIPDAVGKLNQVIAHLGEAADANLDALERLNRENEEARGWVAEAKAAADQCRQRSEALIEAHPELETGLREALVALDTELVEQLDTLEAQCQENDETIVSMMANQGFQDLTGQTLRKVIEFIESLQFQLVALLKRHTETEEPPGGEAAAEEAPARPATASAAQSQEEVDQLLTDLGF